MATYSWIKYDSSNVFLHDDTKPLPETVLTNHHWDFVVFSWGQFHMKCSRYLSLLWVSKLDESMARRHLKSPLSLSGSSLHLAFQGDGQGQTRCSQLRPWVQLICLLFVCLQDIANPIFDLENSKFKVKVIAKVKYDGHICSHQYVCFLFHGDRTIFGWDIPNSIFDLENRPKSNQVIYSLGQGHQSCSKLEQLECMHSEDNPRCPIITHTIESYWIPSQNKTKSKSNI